MSATRAHPGSSRGARPVETLERVRRILQETCEADGLGRNLQEPARRKAYRMGINRALEEIARHDRRSATAGDELAKGGRA